MLADFRSDGQVSEPVRLYALTFLYLNFNFGRCVLYYVGSPVLMQGGGNPLQSAIFSSHQYGCTEQCGHKRAAVHHLQLYMFPVFDSFQHQGLSYLLI